MSNNNGHMQEARKAIQSFVEKYAPLYPNGDHVELVQMAAFPIAVTVHLLYQIWANFGTFVKNGVAVKLHALAVNDCIQSNLFRQTGPDLFEMDPYVRQCLLQDLRANRGNQFVKEELAAFLYQYSRHNTQGNAWRNYYDAQQWAAIMEVDTRGAAEQILSSLAQELQKKNTSRGLGIVNLIAALEKDNKQLSGLLQKALSKPDSLSAEPAGVTSKRIVLTDQVVEGRQPVRINLPQTLSNRLKTIVKRDASATDETDTIPSNRTHALFLELDVDIDRTEVLEMSRLLVRRKQFISDENVSVFQPGSENPASEVRDQIDKYFSEINGGDTAIIYGRYGANTTVDGGFTPALLNELIRKHFPGLEVDVICFLEGNGSFSAWYDERYPKFTLITAGYKKNASGESLFRSAFLGATKNTTYSQFYNELLRAFLLYETEASIFNLPHLISAGIDWDHLLFTKKTYDAIDEAVKMISDMGGTPASEDAITELTEVVKDGLRDVGREKVLALIKISFLHQDKQTVKSMWLLQKEYDYEMGAPMSISSTTMLWTQFFDGEGNNGNDNIVGIVKLLFQTNILFIGIGPQMLSGLNPFRLRTIRDICRVRRILLYFVLEEACQWQQLGMEDLLLGETILSDYLAKEGRESFITYAYEDVDNLIGRKESEEKIFQGKTYGIFIGIDQYMDKSFNLHASVSDADKMLEALVNAQLLEADNRRMFYNGEATRENVVSFFQGALASATSDDTIIFYFSGHSSNQQTNSALFFHDLDVSSEYTTQAENGILTDADFYELVKAAPNNPTIVLILDTHGGSRRWLDENNPRHYSLMATHLEEKCYELNGVGGMLTDAIAQCINKQPRISYLELYKSVLESFLAFSHKGNQWQTPLFVLHKQCWNEIFLPKKPEITLGVYRFPKTYEDLDTRDTLQCIYYSQPETGTFTFYNQVKFALHEKRVNIEQLSSWSAIDKSFAVHNRFPDIIFIGLRQSMYAYEPKYNIEKLLAIADAMQIPVYFILEDESKADPSVYKEYPLLPADGKPVISGEDVSKLIREMEKVTEPITRYLKPEEENYETWGISIGITHYENLPGLPMGVHNSRRFSDWLSGRLKNKIKRENCFTFTTGSDIQISRSDIDETVMRLAGMATENRKRALYIYLCGYTAGNSDDFLLYLAPWSPDRSNAVVNITEYIDVLSNAGYAKVVVFAEYVPIDVVVERPGRVRSSANGQHPAPTCFYELPLRVNDNIPSELNSIVLDGLYGEAAVKNSHTITTSSFRDYIDKRFELEGISGSPAFSIRNSETKYFVLADLDPAFASFSNARSFKQKWILIAGTGKDRLSQPEWMMSNALARTLAKSGYGVITGGWPGVDAVAAEAYAIQLAEDKILDKSYLQQVVLETQELVYPGGLIRRVANEDLWYETVLDKAHALVMIGGLGGTYLSYENAERANVPVIPIGATGGDAARASREMEKRRLLPQHLLDDLKRPINNYDDAERIASAICQFFDDGMRPVS